MKKLLFILLFLSGVFHYLPAQITFQKTFVPTGNDYKNSLQQTSDGGYVIASYSPTTGAGYNVYLIKTDANGDTLWIKNYGGTGHDHGYSVEQTTDGGYIVSGYTHSFGLLSDNLYLIKTDTNGNVLWSKNYNFGSGNHRSYSLQQTSDGGYIITGHSTINSDVYLIKTDANGDIAWQKIIGGTGTDEGNSIQQTSDGGYIIAGSTNSFTAGNYDVYLIKSDTSGNVLWAKTYGGTGDDRGLSVQQTNDGGYIITGYTFNFGASGVDIYLIKTNATGDTLWTRSYGGISYDYGYFVQQTNDNGYIISGQTESFAVGSFDVYLIKSDSIGNLLWSKTFGGSGPDQGWTVRQTSDGGYIIGGTTYSAGDVSVYLIKTDEDGNSGCNEGNPATITGSPLTLVTSPVSMVSSGGTINTPVTLSGSGGAFVTLCTSVGLNESVLDNSFNIYPNPSSGNFIISFQVLITKSDLEIFNIFGEKVFVGNIFNESKKEIKLKNLSSGIYFVKVFDGEKYYCRKIIFEQD